MKIDLCMLIISAVLATLLASSTCAEVTPDGSLGTAGALAGPDDRITADNRDRCVRASVGGKPRQHFDIHLKPWFCRNGSIKRFRLARNGPRQFHIERHIWRRRRG